MTKRTLILAGPGEHFGAEVASRFIGAGFAIALLARNTVRLERTAEDLRSIGGSVLVHPVDFSNIESIQQAVAECSSLMPPWECCIYNAKSSPSGNVLELQPEELQKSLSVNVVGGFALAQSLIKDWPYSKSASIIFSGGGFKDRPSSGKLALAVGKGAEHSLALALSLVTSSLGIRTKEIIIDGVVRPDGPIFPEDLADYYLKVHDDFTEKVAHEFPPGSE